MKEDDFMCVFCEKVKENNVFLYSDELVVAFYDKYPVNKGHVLIVPRRHAIDYFEASLDEKRSIDTAIVHLKRILDEEYKPDGYNIGINCGKAAGQTVFHLHVHLIPRYKNDMDDPRGGVRGVIPHKQKY